MPQLENFTASLTGQDTVETQVRRNNLKLALSYGNKEHKKLSESWILYWVLTQDIFIMYVYIFQNWKNAWNPKDFWSQAFWIRGIQNIHPAAP